MVERIAHERLMQLASSFKVVAVTGPRQSGKTTLVKHAFPEKPYVSLENPDSRRFSIDDPHGFLEPYIQDGAIFDEIQQNPELFSYLQEIVDNAKSPGKFILTGSNNFLLNEHITQSMAGRVGYLHLLPFSFKEMGSYNLNLSENEYILTGFYPPVHDQKINAIDWLPAYIKTYIERDVRQVKNVSNLLVFEKFMRLLAGRTGQELNHSSLSVEVGVDSKTIQSWLSILAGSFIVFFLPPFHKNFNKTIVKRPKLYFYDVAVASSLLGIHQIDHVMMHPLRGALFECMIMGEIMKQLNNTGKMDSIYFWRDKTGREIDLIIDKTNEYLPVEIKSGKTVHDEFFKNIRYWLKLTGQKYGKVIYAGDKGQNRSEGINVIGFNDYENFL